MRGGRRKLPRNSKGKTHVNVPGGVACGQPGANGTGLYRDMITCERCKQTDAYKKLPRLSAQWSKTMDKRRRGVS